ncbi:MAG: hypothetical protein KGY60_08240 [Bacteroidales bacterium]|nr:hypothetical protein [Bacteroidales bacterium]
MLFNQLLHIVLFVVFLLTYILAYNYVRPFLFNRKRLVSTLLFKVTYMVYLLILLLFVYLFLLFGANRVEYHISDMMFFLALLLLFLPNIAILVRRGIKRYRITYNYLFTFVNILATYFLLIKLMENNWFI